MASALVYDPVTGKYTSRIELTGTLANSWTERVTKAMKVITSDHAAIHEGEAFYSSVKADILAGGTLKMTFTTPTVNSGKYVHFRPTAISSSADKLLKTMTETPTSISGGTNLIAYNRNRISSNLSLSTLKTGVTLTESPVVVDASFLGGGTGVGNSSSGSITGEANEVLLRPETVYSIVLTNGSSSTNTVFLKLFWYEEDYA